MLWTGTEIIRSEPQFAAGIKLTAYSNHHQAGDDGEIGVGKSFLLLKKWRVISPSDWNGEPKNTNIANCDIMAVDIIREILVREL